MNAFDPWIVVGKIVGTQGLRGEVRVHSYSDFPERFEVPGQRWLRLDPKQQPKPIALIQGYQHGGKHNVYIVKFEGINSCEQAETLRNHEFLVEETDRPNLKKDEFYVADLIGCEVFDRERNEPIGRVTAVIPAGNDLLEISTAQGTQLIPFVEAFVPHVDLEKQRIEIITIPGLLQNKQEDKPEDEQED